MSLKREPDGSCHGAFLFFGPDDDAGVGVLAPFVMTRDEFLEYDYEADQLSAFGAFDTTPDEEDEEAPPPPVDAYGYWKKRTENLPSETAALAKIDAQSVFWERRLRCIKDGRSRLVAPPVRRALENDEVRPVRVAAGGPAEIEPA